MNKSSKRLSINDTPQYCITEIKIVKLANVNRIMIGNLNINSLPNKFDQLNDIGFSVDILVVATTIVSQPLREKCPNTGFFLVRIFPHSD